MEMFTRPFTETHMASHRPCTAEEIFIDFRGRRNALVRALTHDVEKFYGLCDPGKDNLCLYGHPNGAWEVKLPAEEVPPELPEPSLGINFARDDVDRRDWLSLVAVHSDSWLFSVAFYFGAPLTRIQRKRLFNLINDLPTLFEVVTDRKPVKDKPTVDRGITEAITQVVNETVSCGCCGGRYNAEEFWIGCDVCEWWFHGRCIMITPAKAETLKQYKCASCNLRRCRT